MIHFFTDPYKDELIYSAIARYHYYTGNVDYKDTLQELFGKRSIIPSLEIGSNIDILAKNLGDRYTAENIIKNHTIFPFYSPFLPKDRKKELLKEIKYQDGGGLYTKLGMVAGSICKKDAIYYCACCAKKEIQEYGEPYIHREHQLQGVFICPHDAAELKKYPLDKSNCSRIEFIRLDKKLLDLRNIRLVDDKYYDKLYKISKDAYYLLQTDLNNIYKEKILDRYKNLLYEKELTTTSKRIKQRELYEEFISFYDKGFLELMESNIDNDDEYNWLRVVTRNLKRTVHPIRHLLLINFLSGNIENFFNEINNEYNPFGKGPWTCLNSAAEHYKLNVVKKLKITEDYKSRLPVGTFSCECGFVYSRKGPDKLEEDKYKIGRIKKFGKVWENKLREYLREEKYGLRELARLMNCDPKTILKFDTLLSTNYLKRHNNTIKAEEKVVESKIGTIYKEHILNTRVTNPTATRTEIRNMCKKEYMYLYRNDKKWLEDNLPLKSKSINRNKKVDWDKRDIEFVALIKVKYKELLSKDSPIRITKSSIGKSAGILVTLEKNINKLPKTKKYLNQIIETVEEFQIRRCKKIIDTMYEKDECIRLWEIQRSAGIRSKDFEKIKSYIIHYVNKKDKRDMYGKKGS
ncbi:TnsD family transposase [Clostridium brassicae]|uniref:TnsD family transposase n=1 Tax=Clostridium brassicae TaxID=2999072 RepID=A0ABT4D857_9CLOT|nr:TnsD family transposase [Clostridium brassicae]MCY6957426.1 TnsD family transposase [Clostridium brassicae]